MRILVLISVLATALLGSAATMAESDDVSALNAEVLSLYQKRKYKEAIPLPGGR